ncbi:MAG: GNAT family N-acetyltransferase [Steroidobacter sp.]
MTMDAVMIRPEQEGDRAAVRGVNVSAFDTPVEADLVDALREQARPLVSLVAERNGEVVGHILFSPVSLEGHPDVKITGLAPMAVKPEHQNKGVGSALVRAGLDHCRTLNFVAVVVLGHPEYYPRFGFLPSTRFGIRSEYDVPEDVFMAMELRPRALAGKAGLVKYHAAFGAL